MIYLFVTIGHTVTHKRNQTRHNTHIYITIYLFVTIGHTVTHKRNQTRHNTHIYITIYLFATIGHTVTHKRNQTRHNTHIYHDIFICHYWPHRNAQTESNKTQHTYISELTRVPRYSRGNGGWWSWTPPDPPQQYPPPGTTSYDKGNREGHPKSIEKTTTGQVHQRRDNRGSPGD